MRGSRRRERRRVTLPTWLFAVTLVVVTAVVVGLDTVFGTAVGLVPLLIFLPAIVAALGTIGQTAVASVWVFLAVFLAAFQLGGGLVENLGAIGFTAAFGVLSVLGCRYRIRREEEVHRLRSAAAALQRAIMSPLPLRTGQVIVDGLYHPVEEDSMVGGDMYEVAPSPYGTRVLIADVQGKGLPAIGEALAVVGAFRRRPTGRRRSSASWTRWRAPWSSTTPTPGPPTSPSASSLRSCCTSDRGRASRRSTAGTSSRI